MYCGGKRCVSYSNVCLDGNLIVRGFVSEIMIALMHDKLWWIKVIVVQYIRCTSPRNIHLFGQFQKPQLCVSPVRKWPLYVNIIIIVIFVTMSCFALPDEGVLDESVLSDVNEQLFARMLQDPAQVPWTPAKSVEMWRIPAPPTRRTSRSVCVCNTATGRWRGSLVWKWTI